jgi:uncharacterized membrane protein
MLEIIGMKLNFWFAALSPFVSAVVAFVTAAAVMRGSRINSSNRAGANIWDVC